MVLENFMDPKTLGMKPYYAIPVGAFFVVLGFISSAMIFPAELSIVMVALSSLIILPYVLKIFEFEELHVDLDELVEPGTGELKGDELKDWVVKCLRDGFTPQQIKASLVSDNVDKVDSLLWDLGVINEISRDYIHKSNIITRHQKTIEFYVYLFIGMFIGYALLYMILSPQMKELAFKNQLDVIQPGPGGHFKNPGFFMKIIITFITYRS